MIVMKKRISRIGLVVLFGLGAAIFICPNFARAAGTYKLDYPKGYGGCCTPNAQQFGYFHTSWREWPGEVRLDKTFPRSIGMESIRAPEGQEIIPPPKAAKPAPKGAEEAQPKPGEEMEQPPEGTQGEQPAEPGKETPALPGLGLPAEPGGFNPLPSLPPDLNAPAPQIPQGKDDNNPSKDAKPESDTKSDSQDKGNTDNPSTSPAKTDDKGSQIKVPSNSSKLSRLNAVSQTSRDNGLKTDRASMSQPGVHGEATPAYPSNNARGATYHEPVESPMSARLSRNIATQSYQTPSDSSEATAVVQSDLQADASSNELRRDAPPVAVDGFCPVELSLHGRWAQGDPRWTVVYKGFVYRLSGNAQRQEFMANPEKFVPGNGGFDPVISLAEKRNVPGQVSFCAAYKGRIYMFSSAATQETFHNNPELYIGALK
jgi:YHS domain-containing protein